MKMEEFLLRDMTPDGLTAYAARQLGTFFPDGHPMLAETIRPFMDEALERTRLCLTGIKKRKFRDGDRVLPSSSVNRVTC